MRHFSCQITIIAPPEKVWAALSDIGEIYRWNPSVNQSYVISPKSRGVGSKRHCDLPNNLHLDEEVVKWEVNEEIAFRIIKSNMGIEKGDTHFNIYETNGKTKVIVSPDYELKWGWLGRLWDRVYVEKHYKESLQNSLKGLKKYVEGAA